MNIDRLFRFSGMDINLENPQFIEALKEDLENIINLIAQLPESDEIKNLHIKTQKLENLASDEPFEDPCLNVIAATCDAVLANTPITFKNMIKI